MNKIVIKQRESMKKIYLSSLLVILLFGSTNAFAANFHPAYANTFTTNSIIDIQHSIMMNSIQIFNGTAAAALGQRAKFVKHDAEDEKYLYGTTPMYGWPRLYGEYRDGGDSTATPTTQIGRNGGDVPEKRPEVSNLWLTWQHFDNYMKFKNYEGIDTNADLIMAGLTIAERQHKNNILSKWGVFGGFTSDNQKNDFINIDGNGGFAGLYTGYTINNINLSFAINAGTLYNNLETDYNGVEFANAWAGAALKTNYNIALTDSFTLQPSFYAGYTWIGSANYASASNDSINNQNINSFELTPEIRAITHMGKGWFASFDFKYAFMLGHGGDVFFNGTQLEDLSAKDYAEYGLAIEKSIDRFNIAVNIDRRDGGLRGWAGGFNLKYIF